MRIYVAGPMSGLPEYNYPAFHAEAARLRSRGFHVENPADNPSPPCGTWQGYMRLALAQLVTCQAIALLPGWNNSRGATIEHRLALELGLSVLYHEPPNPNITHHTYRLLDAAHDIEMSEGGAA